MLKRNNDRKPKRHGSTLWSGGRLGLPFAMLVASMALGATDQRVLLLHSFGRDFAPFDAFSETFRTELARQMSGAVIFYDFDLESASLEGGEPEDPLTAYLVALFASHRPDLVVPIGGPATRFAQKHRERLFPSTPMLIAATDQRHLQSGLLTTNDTVVSVANDNARMIESILQLLPGTTNIAVVVGNSPLEKFWLAEMRREFQTFTERANFDWFNQLSFTEMQRRVRLLPPRSAIFFGLLYVDAEGVPYPGQRSLTKLHAVANAPIFGLHETQMGYGIVGGPLMAIEDLGRNTARVAARVLRGEPPDRIKTPPQLPGSPVYDWRELQRWGISERSLPPGSIIRFRQPTFWQLYKWRVIIAVVIGCGFLGAMLYAHAARLRAARQAQAAFTREIILSQENERKRIAFELHDGLGQDLLLLKNRLGLLAAARTHPPEEIARQLGELSATASQAIGEVRAISQALRPSALEQIGLTKALEWMIEQMREASELRVSAELENIDGLLAPDMEMNLYRIVQEGLNNVIKHAQATRAIVSVKREPSGISLSILDNGRGFSPQDPLSGRNGQPTLGLATMAERAKMLSGKIEIQSAQGTGTRLTLTLPLPELQNETPKPVLVSTV